MAVAGFSVKQVEQKEFASVVLPEDSYQCVIDRVELRTGKKYMSEEDQDQLLFYLKPLNVGPEFADKILWYQTTTSFFNGVSSSSKMALKASKLYQFIRTIYKFYKPEVKVENMEPEEITDEVINSLEGKQVMSIVDVGTSGKNRVIQVMAIKEEIKTDGAKLTPDQELEKIMTE